MIHEIGHLSSRPRIYRRKSRWRRVCLAWDCTDLELAVLTGFPLYMVAQILRVAATGVW
jgi:hypothetical protein